ncbi:MULTISPECIES: hypothetical protein [Pseudarthrobacter]|uniref:hypothetical protein n=1 Tax=Pseudarthrobacter TaxID=1742993 RepID=UPI0013DBD496|nr:MULTISPECIES: hypothetical protein [Pseudarthrobacter]MDP9999359.1 hypothetical protein [Pseudarthrobacter sulfonivorans]
MTLAAGRARNAGPVLHSRLCAIITAASCIAHLALAVENHHGAWLNVLMLALAAVCVPCVVHIWRHCRVTALRRVMASALLMVVVHGVLLLASGASGHGHSTGMSSVLPTSGAAASGAAGAAGLLAVIGMEITTALLAATLVARLRSSPPSL